MNFETFYKRLLAKQQKLRPVYGSAESLEFLKNNLYRTELEVKGFSVPQSRLIYKELLTELKEAGLSPHQIAEIWIAVWKKSKQLEMRMMPLFYFGHKTHFELSQNYMREILAMAKDLENWAHSDGLSQIYARFREADPTSMDRTLELWNRSSNPWLRRQSLVSLIYYSSQRKKVPSSEFILRQIKPLIDDPHPYVQKAVGWTLRESLNVHRDSTLAFIKKHILRLSPYAFTASMEKMPPSVRARLRAEREAHRESVRKKRRK